MEFTRKDYEYFDYIIEHKKYMLFNLSTKAEDYLNSCEGAFTFVEKIMK